MTFITYFWETCFYFCFSINSIIIPTSVVFALDLGLLIPGMVLGAILLWKRQSWGAVVGTIMNIKAVSYALVLLVSTAYTTATTGIGDPLAPLYALLGVGNLIASGLLLTNMQSQKKQGDSIQIKGVFP